jgi:ppGpp synthetase/RelA/SpoT-type nucleotidyltranferase
MSLARDFRWAELVEFAMKHVEPAYSREEVDAAGDLIIDPPPLKNFNNSDDWLAEDFENMMRVQEAYDVVYNFRSSHSFPLNTFQTTLRDKAHKEDPNCIVAQRIKRLPTIIAKLSRRKLKLTEIQDIGGCRAVLSSVRRVRRLVKIYKESDLKHALIGDDDYITHPKVTGYRGYHLIYSYYSDKKKTYNGLKIEMQFRTALQHAWATAVETVGIFTGQALKSNQGNKKWKRFFALMGSAIALREHCPLVPNMSHDPAMLKADIRRYADTIGVIDHLRLFNAVLHQTETQGIEGAHYFLLKLLPKENRIVVEGFTSKELGAAQERYREVEREVSAAAGDDVVLVSTNSMDALRRAYPNYFLDTHAFIAAVQEALKAETATAPS